MAQQSAVAEEYRDLSPLQTRILTHERYTVGPHDLEGDVLAALALGPEDALLDVGSGTGAFLRDLRERGHRGRLCALDASEAAVAAAGAVEGVTAVLGDAQAVPFGEGEFDAVVARHMLYHVPEPVAAVREARRVLRDGGRFVAVVNREATLPRITAVLDTVLERHGVATPAWRGGAVHGGNLPALVEEVFGAAQVRAVDSELVFKDPEPVLRYCLSLLTLSGVPQDSPLHAATAADVEAEVHRAFAALEGGEWRDPKGYVVCTGVR